MKEIKTDEQPTEFQSMHTHHEHERVCEICVLDARIHLAFVERELAIQRMESKREEVRDP